MLKLRDMWERSAANIEGGTMPPDGMPKPTLAEREKMAHFIQAALTKADCALNDPGRVTMRRLNRAEYNNTVRDLLKVDLRPADEFPSDDVGYGFDNIGDVLSLSPLLMEKYLRAAEQLSKAAIRTPEDAQKPIVLKGARLEGGEETPGGGRTLMSEGVVTASFEFPAPGTYEIVLRAYQTKAGPEDARIAYRIDGRDIRTLDVKATRPNNFPMPPFKVQNPGKQSIGFAFLNDYYNTDNPNKKLRGDRNFVLESISIRGPLGAKGLVGTMPASHRAILLDCKPGEGDSEKDVCTRKIARNFARRAFRRTPTESEVSRLARYPSIAKSAGLSYEKGVQLMVQAALVSPHFLFRMEPEPAATVKSGRRDLNDFELASRLSYFLWSSMPDDTLLSLAEQGKLRNPDALVAQAKRMLADPKSRALTDNFAAQWLQLRSIQVVTPDTAKFPTWNDGLRSDMRSETELYFDYVVRNDRSILEFLDSKYTFLNERLARHYGNTAVTGNEFRKVALLGDQRGGLITHASVLTVTSNPTRTSPVKRGKWVLDNILGTPPPPAPPNVPQLDDDKAEVKKLAGTLRQRLEAHRANPACASCHKRMDPIGFGLENYNAIGEWRTKDGEADIDNSGTLVDGRSFKGSAQLKKLLLQNKEQFAKAFTERLLTYALGRGVVSRDRCNLDAMAKSVQDSQYRFSSVVFQIVRSQPFREKRADTPAPAKPKVAQN